MSSKAATEKERTIALTSNKPDTTGGNDDFIASMDGEQACSGW